MKKIKVIIVDDSAVVRNVLSTHLRKYEDIEIVGTAAEPYQARDLIVKMKPDVITLDIEMPKMSGLEFITVLMKHYPLPIIIISSLVSGKCETSLKCLELGAFDVVAKPSSDIAGKLTFMIDDLHRKICAAAAANAKNLIRSQSNTNTIQLSQIQATEKIIAIGASTGGTEAIRKVLERLPSNIPPIIISQHMPAGFTTSFAERLNNICPNLEVKEAEDNDSLSIGTVLLAPGDFHLLLKRDGAKFKINIKQGPKISGHRPSVDAMFLSVAASAGKNAIGVILTGMGGDGSDGIVEMFKKGADTIAQSEETCVVFGMPREAIIKGGIKYIVGLEKIPEKIIEILGKKVN